MHLQHVHYPELGHGDIFESVFKHFTTHLFSITTEKTSSDEKNSKNCDVD